MEVCKFGEDSLGRCENNGVMASTQEKLLYPWPYQSDRHRARPKLHRGVNGHATPRSLVKTGVKALVCVRGTENRVFRLFACEQGTFFLSCHAGRGISL